MSLTGIILAAAIVGGVGLFIGVFLGVSGKAFAVEVDEREEAIIGVLPGNNCGGCGYAGCDPESVLERSHHQDDCRQ